MLPAVALRSALSPRRCSVWKHKAGDTHPAGRREGGRTWTNTETLHHRVFEGCPGCGPAHRWTSAISTLTAAKRQQRWRRGPSPLSVVQLRRIHWFLILLLLVFCSDQPLAGEVFKNDVIITEWKRKWWRLEQQRQRITIQLLQAASEITVYTENTGISDGTTDQLLELAVLWT